MLTNPSTTNDLTSAIIGGAMKVHRAVGPGLLESAYIPCLELELKELDFRVELRKPVPLIYRGLKLDACYCLDMLVNGTVVVEIKSVSATAPIHEAQLLTYLRLMRCPVGLLINFNDRLLKDGITRIINPDAREK